MPSLTRFALITALALAPACDDPEAFDGDAFADDVAPRHGLALPEAIDPPRGMTDDQRVSVIDAARERGDDD